MFHNIKSARYAIALPQGGYGPTSPVITTMRDGSEQNRRANDDIEGGGMLAFLREGGTIDPFGSDAPEPPPLPVPASLSPLQARNGLRAWGIGKEEIKAFFQTISDPIEKEKAEDAWEYATSIEFNNPLIAECAAYLHKTDEEIKQFFRDAAVS